jgi:hypothetical protein
MEELDLNKLKRRKESVEKTPEERISELRNKIAECEAHLNDPSELDKFLALDPATQEERLHAANASLSGDDKYSRDDYIDELRKAGSEPSMWSLRLAAAKSELEELLKSTS